MTIPAAPEKGTANPKKGCVSDVQDDEADKAVTNRTFAQLRKEVFPMQSEPPAAQR